MKFFGNKSSLIANLPSLSSTDQLKVDNEIKKPGVIDLNLNQLIYKSAPKSATVKLLNYTEPFTIRGTRYTLFYTEFDTKLAVDDKVYIVSGNYDTNEKFQRDKFSEFSDGYTVLLVDQTKVVLDIEYDGLQPWVEEDIDNFLKVYVASSQEDFEYFIQTTSTRDFPYLVNRFSNIGTYSTNNILYINGTFSVSGNEWGILGFTSSTGGSLTYSNSFLILSGTTSGYLQDITNNINTGIFSKYLSATLECNRNLKIMNDSFTTTSGVKFKKGYAYKWCKICDGWRVNVMYHQPFITKLNFRNGIFKSGKINQGLIGTHIETIDFQSGSEKVVNLTTILNTNWTGGSILNGDITSSASYKTIFQSGLPFIQQMKDNRNNLGYNFVYDSFLDDLVINKVTIHDSIVGHSLNTIVYEYLTKIKSSYDVQILTLSEIYNSKIIKNFLTNATIFSSKVINSEVFNSKSINSEFEKSVFNKSNFISDKIIKLDNYDERTVTWWNDGVQETFKLYKFYVSPSNFNRLEEFQSFYFDGIQINKSGIEVLNFFDDKFTIDAYRSSYDEITGKQLRKVIVQLSTAAENLKTIDSEDITYSNILLNNTKDALPSIDLMITPGDDFVSYEQSSGSDTYNYNLSTFEASPFWGTSFGTFSIFIDSNSYTFTASFTYSSIYDSLVLLGTGSWTFSGENFEVKSEFVFGTLLANDDDEDKYSANPTQDITKSLVNNTNAIDVNRSYILDSDFKSGYFYNSIWSSGNYINYNIDHTLEVANNSEYYSPIDIDPNLGTLTVNLLSSYRRRIAKQGDVVFFNNLELDSTLLGYSNLVKLPDTYRVTSLNENNNTFQLEDIINGTESVFFTFTQSVSSTTAIKTSNAENAYNYLHPVVFVSSTIKSGIFRRGYFKNTVFNSDEFDVQQRDPVQLRGGITSYTNWRQLLISDTIFGQTRNIFKSGLLLYSHWIAGSDVWENGIFQNSIWNTTSYNWSFGLTSSFYYTSLSNKFKNGIFRQSRWVNGIFENGLFYRNNSNKVYTTTVYDNLTNAYYRVKNSSGEGKSRWSFLNGVFEDGVFELSNFEMGNFENGQFFQSTFLDGFATGGVFGRKTLPFTVTRVGAGTFSGLNVVSANFEAENPTGQLDDYFSIEWLNGIFNNGNFGVRVVSASYSEEKLDYRFKSNWYDGKFNNGSFQDTAVWHFGEFNGGKFTSYWGYPFIITSSYSTSASQSFAWRDGYFNGGIFGNANLGTNSTWFNGQFNGGIFTGRYWQNGIFTRGYFIGSGTTSTTLAGVPNFVSNFSESYYGLWNSGYVNELSSKLFKNKESYSVEIRNVDKKKKDFTAKFTNVLWRGGTFSHGDGQIENSVWTGGTFESGNFVNSSFNPYLNYLVNGEFKTSINNEQSDAGSLDFWNYLYSDYEISSVGLETETNLLNGNFDVDSDTIFSKKLLFSATSSNAKLVQTAGLSIGDTYKLRVKLKYNQNCLIKYGSYTNILRNGNLTEGYAYWEIGLTASNPVSNPASLIIATGSPGYFTFTNNSTSDGQAYLFYRDVLVENIPVNFSMYHFNRGAGNPFSIQIGSCDLDQVTIEDQILLENFVFGINATFSAAGLISPGSVVNVYTDNFVPQFKDFLIRIDSSSSNQSIDFTGLVLSNDSTLYLSNLTQSTILETSFIADAGDFSIDFIPTAILSPSAVPIYNTASVEINYVELIRGESGFNTSTDCVWKGGRFKDSEFYYSVWENGLWENGLAMGMIWKNGVARYMNAFNVYWQGGIWKNGNWNGSPWSLENITEDGCLYSYGPAISPSMATKTLNFGGDEELRAILPTLTGGIKIVATNSIAPANTQNPQLDTNNPSAQVIGGYFYVESSNTLSTGKRYKITIEFSKLSIGYLEDKDRPAIYFSIGQLGSPYGNSTGLLFPDQAGVAVGLSNLSERYQITSLEGHTGNVVADLYYLGYDGYESTNPGTLTEIIESVGNGVLYIHVDMYGAFELIIDSIQITEEICTKTGVVSPGFARDLMTHISDYRQSILDSQYRTIHMNNVFTETIDQNWPSFPGTIQQLRFTYSNQTHWSFSTFYSAYNASTINCTNTGPSIVASSGQSFPVANYASPRVSTDKLTAMANNNPDIFSQSGEYQITLKYFCDYNTQSSVTNADVKFDVDIGYSVAVTNNGGFRQSIQESIRVLPVVRSGGSSGCSSIGFKYGRTPERTLTFTFEPLGFAEYSILTKDSYRFSIRKYNSTNGARLVITHLKIQLKNTQYSSVYNNKLYTTFDTNPEINDVMALPSSQVVSGVTSSIAYAGASSQGLPISIRFGNGIFTSGTASAFSSIWEFGVWNEGWRYDRNIIYFTNFMSFAGTQKPLVYAGAFQTKKVKKGEIANQFDKSISQIIPTQRVFTVALYRTIGNLTFDDGTIVIQDPTPEEKEVGTNTLRSQLKIGDRVNVGNVIAIDGNGERRLITDTFRVVDIISPKNISEGSLDVVYLQIILNYGARTIQRDSSDHLITITKNIWLNGAFLNGVFKGVWTNGLFKGGPYITKMKDSQWINGIFDGGHFQGKSVQYPVGTDEDLATFSVPSGLVQYFRFKDNNIAGVGQFRYNSWIDLNHYKTEGVSIAKESLIRDPVDFVNYSENNYYGYPTKDILQSKSSFRDGESTTVRTYDLGYKIKKDKELTYDRGLFLEPIGFDTQFSQGAAINSRIGLRNFNNLGWTLSNVSELISDPQNNDYNVRIVSNIGTLSNDKLLIDLSLTGAGAFDSIGIQISNTFTEVPRVDRVLPDLPTGNLTPLSRPRYTMLEFEVATNRTQSYHVGDLGAPNVFPLDLYSRYPVNQNRGEWPAPYSLVDQFVDTFDDATYSGFPVNHLTTNQGVKREYFYNKQILSMNLNKIYDEFEGGRFEFSSIRYFIVDQIPFFLYATESRINQKVVVPLGGVSPFIDFRDDDTNFLDSIVISETIFTPLENPQIVVTPGSRPGLFTEVAVAGQVRNDLLVSGNSSGNQLTGGTNLPSSSAAQSNSNPSSKVPQSSGPTQQQQTPSGRN